MKVKYHLEAIISNLPNYICTYSSQSLFSYYTEIHYIVAKLTILGCNIENM